MLTTFQVHESPSRPANDRLPILRLGEVLLARVPESGLGLRAWTPGAMCRTCIIDLEAYS